jgi:hypothetical protein
VAWPHLGGGAESGFTDALVRSARARGFLFIRKRPRVLPRYAREMLAAMPGQPPPLPTPPDEPPAADPRAAALADTLAQMLRGRFPAIAVAAGLPGDGPACCLTFRAAGLAPALPVLLLSQDFVTFKVLLAWRRRFDGLAGIRLGGYAATVLGARLPGLAMAREVHLPELPECGFVSGGGTGEMAARIAAALAIGRRLSALVADGG